MTAALAARAVMDKLAARETVALLDVREWGVHGMGHPLHAANCPFSAFEARLPVLVPDPGAPVVLMDDGDGLAERAAERAEALGYGAVAVMDGGAPGWAKAGFELFDGVHVPSKAFGEVVERRRATPSISARDLADWKANGRDFVILDARPWDEYRRMAIPGGRCVPGAELVYRVHDLAPDPATDVVVNCAGRTRSIIGTQSLIDAGLPNRVVALENGTMGWELAGRECWRGADLSYGPVGEAGLARALEIRDRLLAGDGIDLIDQDRLAAWEVDDRPTYLLDVRAAAEYEAGHLPGAVHAPGGQLVQETDRWLAVLGARVVLADNDGVRAAMTAHWLKAMGWDASVLPVPPDSPGLETGWPRPVVPALPAGIARWDAEALFAAWRDGTVRIVDVGPSMAFRDAHVPGAAWTVRPAMAEALGALDSRPLVLTGPEGPALELAALEAVSLGRTPRALAPGVLHAWRAAGRPLESSPDDPPDAACVDYLFWHHDRHRGNQAAAQAYLDWETALPARVARDGTALFEVN